MCACVQRIKDCNYNYVLSSLSFFPHLLLAHTLLVLLHTHRFLSTDRHTSTKKIKTLPTLDHHGRNQQWFSSYSSCQILHSHINRRRGLPVTVRSRAVYLQLLLLMFLSQCENASLVKLKVLNRQQWYWLIHHRIVHAAFYCTNILCREIYCDMKLDIIKILVRNLLKSWLFCHWPKLYKTFSHQDFS